MKLKQKFVKKPWGQDSLPALFDAAAGTKDRIGEVWFESAVPLQLMIKYLFTSEKLSIQVHPNDQQAQARGGLQGKEECWYISDAKPGSVIGIGTKDTLNSDTLRSAALSGKIEQLIDWKPVKQGDFFYIPAGTIHAIGAGIRLIEVQQNTDITYRLYDYGRPRELHLDSAVDVADAAPYDMANYQHFDTAISQQIVHSRYFRLFQIVGQDTAILNDINADEWQVLPLEGRLTSMKEYIESGECAVFNDISSVDFSANTRCLIACTA